MRIHGGGGSGSVLSGEAPSDAGLDATQMHYVTSYSSAELRMSHCKRVRKMPLSWLDLSMLIVKTEADWIDLWRRVVEVCVTCLPVVKIHTHNSWVAVVQEP